VEHWLETIRDLVDTPGHDWLAALVVIIWTFIEGETIVIVMGFLAKDNVPHLWVIIVAAFVGSLAGDQTWFFVGRYKGRGIIAKRPFWQLRAEKVYAILHRHQYWLILGFRFLYGLRNITPFALGLSEVKTSRFILLNVIGAAVWATTFAMAGYLLGAAAEGVVEHLRIPILVGFLSVVATVWLVRLIARLRKARKVAAQQASQPSDAPSRPA
jgi:membrane protein DedA with SNARE-associated domain